MTPRPLGHGSYRVRVSARLVALAAAAALCGCASATRIESTWTDPTFSSAPFERIAVVALFDSMAESRTFEQTAARELEERGVAAVPSHAIVTEDRMYEEAELRERLAEAGVDAVLIYRLIAVDERNVYRNPAPYLNVPPGVVFGDPYYWYYYPRWDYYWHWRSSWYVTNSRGYWEPLAYVIVESSLYDARRNRLVWTAKSATMDDARFDELATSIADRISDELAARRVIAANGAGSTGNAR
jgi:hypothetical protein